MLVDFSHPALYSPTYFLIPAAKSFTNFLAAALRFQTPVIMGLFTFKINTLDLR